MSFSPARAWPHLRAIFVCFHVSAVLVAATPSMASALQRSSWNDPTVKAELGAWADRFGLPAEEFTDRLWAIATAYQRVRQSTLRPLSPYLDFAEVNQSWQMFVAPHLYPTRLHLDELVGGGWSPLFEERSPVHTWMAPALSVERLRASIFRWGWPAFSGAWKQACRALAERRFAENPDATSFRCRFRKARTPSPEELRAGTRDEGRWVLQQIVERTP